MTTDGMNYRTTNIDNNDEKNGIYDEKLTMTMREASVVCKAIVISIIMYK